MDSVNSRKGRLRSCSHQRPRDWLGRAAVVLVGVLLLGVRIAAAADVTLNLKDADIRALVATVSQVTGKNFIVDPRVKGKVTVISSRPMDEGALYKAFLSILEVHGYAAVPAGPVTKIVPDVNARQEGVPTGPAAARYTGDELVTRIIHLKNISGAKLIPILRPLVAQQSHIAAYPPSNVLIITDRASNIDRLMEIIQRIDRAGNVEIDFVHLHYASAADVVRTLTTLVQSEAKGPQALTGQAPVLVADERTNSVLISAEAQMRKHLRHIIEELDRPLRAEGNTQVIYLQYASAKELAPVLTGVAAGIQAEKGKKGAAPVQTGEVKIQADEATNALVISAPPAIQRSLRDVIRRLDIRRAQVLVEAIIAEVSTDESKQLGIQWALDGARSNSAVGVINFQAAGIPIAQALANPPSLATVAGANVAAGDVNGAGTDYALLLSALSSNADTNILSTPSIVTLDNQEAQIVVAQNVPFVTGQFTNTGAAQGSVNPFQTIQRQDVGLILKVKPQINAGDTIQLNIQQEVSNIAPSSQQAADIITDKRSLKTSVLVDDGQILVLGGLIDDQLTQTVQKVPGLGDIPLLGALFRSKTTTKTKRDLMIFLRPTILRTGRAGLYVTGGKYSAMRQSQLDLRQKGIALLPTTDSPLLPEISDLTKPLPAPFQEAPPAAPPH